MGKEKNLGEKEAKGTENPMVKKKDDPTKGAMLTFLDTAKMKADSSLHANTWIYNEIMKLKNDLVKVQKEHEIDWEKLVMLEAQVGNKLGKLKEYEQDLRHLIKERRNKMEQVTSSLCAIVASLGKRLMRLCLRVVPTKGLD